MPRMILSWLLLVAPTVLAKHADALRSEAPAPRRLFPSCSKDGQDKNLAVSLSWTNGPVAEALLRAGASAQEAGAATRQQFETALDAVPLKDHLRDLADQRDRTTENFRESFLAKTRASLAQGAIVAKKLGLPALAELPESKYLPAEPFGLRYSVSEVAQRVGKAWKGKSTELKALDEDMMADPAVAQAIGRLEKDEAQAQKAYEAARERTHRYETALLAKLSQTAGREIGFSSVEFEDALRHDKAYAELRDEQNKHFEDMNSARDARLFSANVYEIAGLSAAIDAGKARRSLPLYRALYEYFTKRPQKLAFVRDLAELTHLSLELDAQAKKYAEEQTELDEKRGTFNDEANAMRFAASAFEPGTTMDLTWAVGIEKGPDGKFVVSSVMPYVGKAKVPGAGVRLAFFDPSAATDGKSQRALEREAAKRWLDEPKPEADPILYCRKAASF